MAVAGLEVSMTGIDKRFGAVRALDGASLHLRPGELHALVGENGAGKTTLMRVFYGALRPDGGEVALGGRTVRFGGAGEAMRAGIGMVSQHYSVIPELTNLQNLMLGAEPGRVLPLVAAERRAESLAAGMGYRFDWRAPSAGLGPSGAQRLEVMKLLWRDSSVMVLDEPTAMLSPEDADALYRSLQALAAAGATVVVVTHRLTEVMGFCRRVTVLRAGRTVGEWPVAGTNAAHLAELMVGAAVGSSPRSGIKTGEPALELRGVSGQVLHGVDLVVRSGEIVGVAGVEGNGQAQLFEAIAGLLPCAGDVLLNGAPVTRSSARHRLAQGLRLIPEDRHEHAIAEEWTLEENCALGLLRSPTLRRGPWIDARARTTHAEAVTSRFGVQHAGLTTPVRDLSGGNQQRLVVGRALSQSPKLLLAFQPACGLDIAATQAVYDAIRAECARGMAALIVAFDLDEILDHVDRVVVMRGGRLFPAPDESRHDRALIGRLMVGAE